MLKFSTRARYGLRAMVDLAINSDLDKPVALRDIAEREGISDAYLEQLMALLRKDGLVRSVRGAQGGYILARRPAQITAGEVIRCLEGPLAPTDCVNEDEPEFCERSGICVTRGMWEKIKEAVAGVLDGTTLEDFRSEAEKGRLSRESYMYYI